MRVGSMFSGVGGLELGLEWAGVGETAWQAELDPHASAVLARHWDVPNLGDVTAVDWSQVEPVDVLCGGFPCQDISYAGLGAGLDGERSGLWWELWRAAGGLRPRWVVVENVAALRARGLDVVTHSLASIGYVGSWATLRASNVGAPHQRARVFLIAADAQRGELQRRRGLGQLGAATVGPEGAGPQRERDGDAAGDRCEDAPDPEGERAQVVTKHDGQPLAGCPTMARRGHADGRGDSPADTENLGHERTRGPRRGGTGPALSGGTAAHAPGGRYPDEPQVDDGEPAVVGSVAGAGGRAGGGPIAEGVRVLGSGAGVAWGPYEPAIRRWEHVLGRRAPDPVDDRGRLNAPFVEWMMGFPEGWTDGLGRNAALRCLGNAVVPQVAEVVGRQLLATAPVPA